MDPITIGLLIAGAGQGINALENWSASQRANRESKRRMGLVEPQLLKIAQGFNTGQDSYMQGGRVDPFASSNTALQSIIDQGPMDLSSLYESLGIVDERARKGALADVRAGSSGLGQRFGTSMTRESNDAMMQLLEMSAARNAQLGMQAYEGQQGRKLQAAGAMGSNAASQGQMQGNFQQQQLQALQMLLGMPMGGQPSGVGNDIGGIGQLLAMFTMMQSMNQQPGVKPKVPASAGTPYFGSGGMT